MSTEIIRFNAGSGDDQGLIVIGPDGQEFTVVHRVCKQFGLERSTQQKKIHEKPELKGLIINLLNSRGRSHPTLVIPRGYTMMWLAGIRKVRPELAAEFDRFRLGFGAFVEAKVEEEIVRRDTGLASIQSPTPPEVTDLVPGSRAPLSGSDHRMALLQLLIGHEEALNDLARRDVARAEEQERQARETAELARRAEEDRRRAEERGREQARQARELADEQAKQAKELVEIREVVDATIGDGEYVFGLPELRKRGWRIPGDRDKDIGKELVRVAIRLGYSRDALKKGIHSGFSGVNKYPMSVIVAWEEWQYKLNSPDRASWFPRRRVPVTNGRFGGR